LWAYQHRRALDNLHPSVLRLLGPEVPEEKQLALTTASLLIGLPPEEQISYAEMISETGMAARQVNQLVKDRLAATGVRTPKLSNEHDSARKFFTRANAEIELLVQRGEARIENLFKNRSAEQIRELLRLVKDCHDNLGAVMTAFQSEAQKHLPKT
jgi:hypothetical protein